MLTSMIILPHSSTSLLLACGLVREGQNVVFYSPSENYRSMAGSIPADLELTYMKLPNAIEVINRLDHLHQIDFILVPSLDVLPDKPREEYAKLCNETFR